MYGGIKRVLLHLYTIKIYVRRKTDFIYKVCTLHIFKRGNLQKNIINFLKRDYINGERETIYIYYHNSFYIYIIA